jgi:hypothetical protein
VEKRLCAGVEGRLRLTKNQIFFYWSAGCLVIEGNYPVVWLSKKFIRSKYPHFSSSVNKEIVLYFGLSHFTALPDQEQHNRACQNEIL